MTMGKSPVQIIELMKVQEYAEGQGWDWAEQASPYALRQVVTCYAARDGFAEVDEEELWLLVGDGEALEIPPPLCGRP